MNNETKKFLKAVFDYLIYVFLIILMASLATSLVACKTVKRDMETDISVINTASTVENTWQQHNDSLFQLSWQKLIEKWTASLDAKIHIVQTDYDTAITDSSGQHPIKSTTSAEVNLAARSSAVSQSEHEVKTEQSNHDDTFEKKESHVTNDSTSHSDIKESVNHTTVKQKIGYMIILSLIAFTAWALLFRTKK